MNKVNEIVLNKTRQLSIIEEVLQFDFSIDNSLQKSISLNFGYEVVTSKFFKNHIPTEAETEYAIYFIEDHLMSNKELINQQETLVSESKALADVLAKNGLQKGKHSRRTIEDLFNNYARIVMGTPSTLMDIEITKEDFATLLILREIMHHLNFESISIL